MLPCIGAAGHSDQLGMTLRVLRGQHQPIFCLQRDGLLLDSDMLALVVIFAKRRVEARLR